jgi:hypothetical protein
MKLQGLRLRLSENLEFRIDIWIRDKSG